MFIGQAHTHMRANRFVEAEKAADAALNVLAVYPDADAAWTYETWGVLGAIAYVRGNYREAQDALAHALKYIDSVKYPKRLTSEITPDKLTTYLADIYHEQGEFHEAETLLRQAGLDAQLASLYLDQGLTAKAQQVIEALVNSKPEALLQDSGESVFVRAKSAYINGELGKAERQFTKVLRARESLYGKGHAKTVEPLMELAQLERLKGQHTRAIQLGEQALAVNKTYWGEQHPKLIRSYDELARTYLDQGRFAEAQQLMESALGIIRKRSSKDTRRAKPRTLISYAQILNHQGQKNEARKVLSEAQAARIELNQEVLPEDVAFLETQAQWADETDDVLIAEEYHKEALALNKTVYGDNHPNQARLTSNLAQHYAQTENVEATETYTQQAQDLWVRYLGPGHLKAKGGVAGQKKKLSAELANSGPGMARYHEVLELAAKSLDGRLLGNSDGTNAPVAEALFKRALEIYEQLVGPNDPELAIVLDNYAEFLRQQGRQQKADELEARAKKVRGY